MAVALCVTGFVVFVVGSVEAQGLAIGRTTIDMVDLPYGPTKIEHVAMLERLAVEHDVTFALIVPDRSGTPAHFDAYVLNGRPAQPTFWGAITEHSSASIRDAVITWTYSVDGSGPDVERFLQALRADGFDFVTATPQVLPTVLEGLRQPGVPVIILTVFAGILIALVAESHRRAPRQRLRRIAGWTPGRIAARELLAITTLASAAFLVTFAGLAVSLSVRGAGIEVWTLCAATAVATVPVAGVLVMLCHVGPTLLSGRRLSGADLGRWRPAAIAGAGILLVVLLVTSASTMTKQSQTAEQLARSLAAEASSGDDVVLGVGFSDERQELAFGRIGEQAIRRGTAEMAMTTMLPQALVVAGDGIAGFPDDVVHRTGVTVLVPAVIAGDADRIEDDTRVALAEGWEVDETDPARAPVIRTQIVPSTAAINRAADGWVDRSFAGETPAPEAPVVVVSDIDGLAPNRIATATRNGEVRFSERAALVRALKAEDVIDVVIQINRVGAVIDRQLAAVRTERTVLLGAVVAATLAALSASAALVADHRTRSRGARRLRFLVGRSPVVDHRRFVLVAAGVCAATVLCTLVTLDSVGAATASAVALLSAAALVAVLSLLLGVAGLAERSRS